MKQMQRCNGEDLGESEIYTGSWNESKLGLDEMKAVKLSRRKHQSIRGGKYYLEDKDWKSMAESDVQRESFLRYLLKDLDQMLEVAEQAEMKSAGHGDDLTALRRKV